MEGKKTNKNLNHEIYINIFSLHKNTISRQLASCENLKNPQSVKQQSHTNHQNTRRKCNSKTKGS